MKLYRHGVRTLNCTCCTFFSVFSTSCSQYNRNIATTSGHSAIKFNNVPARCTSFHQYPAIPVRSVNLSAVPSHLGPQLRAVAGTFANAVLPHPRRNCPMYENHSFPPSCAMVFCYPFLTRYIRDVQLFPDVPTHEYFSWYCYTRYCNAGFLLQFEGGLTRFENMQPGQSSGGYILI